MLNQSEQCLSRGLTGFWGWIFLAHQVLTHLMPLDPSQASDNWKAMKD